VDVVRGIVDGMPRRSPVDWDAVFFAAPNNVIRLRELLDFGVPSRTIARKCERLGPWSRVLPGVVMLGNGRPTWTQQLDAAVRFGPEPAYVTGLGAARLHGLVRGPTPSQVHLLIREKSQRLGTAFVTIERTTRLPDPMWVGGFPVAPLVRAVLDGCRRLTDLDDIRALLAEAVQRGRATPAELLAELNAGSPRGTARPRAVLLELADGVRSTAESWARDLAQDNGLPEVWWNPVVRRLNGTALPTPDAWFDDVAVAWEIDSYEFHLSPKDYAQTLARHNTMTAEGIVVVHTLPSRLRTEPREVLAEVRGALALARQRPRPPLIVRRSR
jgi:hypothetical protein